ncbi:MoxR family ATPase [Salinigranum marinum]|uniref:AAA family ATPase n=1 Tax=Salinigranum marinum TaxID=1515595 RepID=UPI002989FEF8|nr:MoxR family ATPase [Salinigranum marinum]
MTAASELYDRLVDEIGVVLVGREEVVRGLTIGLLTRRHVLLEGVPGVAKTTLASLFARASGLDHRRIQMTPDVLPADITGTKVYRQGTGTFEVTKGPVFANVVVTDEINRATPKTQSALLEAMEEGTVTIEGETFALPQPFVVVATQNPIEIEGTFELPKAQRDRFMLKYVLDLPTAEEELRMLDRFDADPELDASDVEQVVTPAAIDRARAEVQAVYVDAKVKRYILDLVTETRRHSDVAYGVSPRGSLSLLHGSKALAAIEGRDYVVPDDVKALAPAVLSHRLGLTPDALLGDASERDVVAEITERVAPPSVDEVAPDSA